MTTLREGALAFDFPDDWQAGKYDDWQFYLKHFQSVCGGSKAVDFIAARKDCAWLIEVKDFRAGPRQKTLPLAQEIAQKVRDTLAGLATASIRATEPGEKALAVFALSRSDLRVALHMEQPAEPTEIHPIENLADIRQKLKQLLRGIDFRPVIVSLADPNRYPWTVREVPAS